MHSLFDFFNLQLLAGEGASGASAAGDAGPAADSGASGDSTADAGQARLQALGVPKDKISKRASSNVSKLIAAKDKTKSAADDARQVAAADNNAQNQDTEPKNDRLTWEQIMADPEYNQAMQQTIKQRLSKSKKAEEKLEKLAPAIDLIGRSLHIDASDINNLDVDAFVNAINNDSKYYEDKAIELGVSNEMAMKIDQLEREKARRDREEKLSIEQRKLQEHFIKLHQQGEKLKEIFPSFDLQRELQNPVFMRMTAPNVGLSVEDAYYAVHRAEIQSAAMQATAQKVSEKLSNSIQSGARRPVENGAVPQPASVSAFDYRHASREQREALKAQIARAAARGEKIYPPGR